MNRIPSTYLARETLPDGQPIYIRAIKPADREQLQQEFYKLSSSSVRDRFFNAKRGLTPQELSFFTEVDFSQHVALVAEIDAAAARRPVGVGRFIRMQDQPGHCEFAITVAEDQQGRGIGKLLMNQLIHCARDLGISHLDASLFAQNTRMSKLLQRLGLPMESYTEGAIKTVSMAL